jgi:hypothetical protein
LQILQTATIVVVVIGGIAGCSAVHARQILRRDDAQIVVLIEREGYKDKVVHADRMQRHVIPGRISCSCSKSWTTLRDTESPVPYAAAAAVVVVVADAAERDRPLGIASFI